jgi:hypothetical protein
MDKLAQDRMMGALKTGKKPKALPLDKEDMKEMSKLGKGNFIKSEQGDIKKAKGIK